MHKLQLQKDSPPVAIKKWLTDAQAEAQARFMQDKNPEALTGRLASIMDHLIGELYALYSDTPAPPTAIVALGGYGRRELCPYSDIDILFLYEPAQEKQAAKLAESILYILWDLGLKVGHAHRTEQDTLQLAREDTSIKTALLDARFLCGDGELFAQFSQQFWHDIEQESSLSFVEAKLTERDNRHGRFGDSRYRLEPNVKEGKGGLRDVHTLWWLMRYAYRIDSLAALVTRGYLHDDELADFTKANRLLLAVRILLHYHTGFADERLTFDKQLAIARDMGFANSSVNLAITRFMRRYFIAVRTVGTMTRIICALLEDEKKRKPQKPLGWVKLNEADADLFKLDGERLTIANDDIFARHPEAILSLFHVAQEQALDIHPRALRVLNQSLHQIDDGFRANPAINHIFLRILQSEKNPETTLRRMSESGVLGRFIPEFGRVIGQTQFNMYHVFTVDEHTLVALGILHAINSGNIRDEAPLASEIMPRIAQKHVLYLALFCHDIAKGRGGDHSELGELIAVKLAKRFGYTQEEQETVAWLVLNHLYLSNTAFKRDLNDPKTIADFVAFVRTPERLKLLLVLTVADIRAVAPGVWNEWKGVLMRELFTRAMRAMGSTQAEHDKKPKDAVMQTLREHYAHTTPAQLEHYETLGSEPFWAGCTLAQHITIAGMLLDAKSDEDLIMHTSHDDKRTVTEIIISAKDSPGIFARLTGAIALAGATIVSAKIFTLGSGRIVDIFQIQDMTGHAFDRPSKLARMAVYAEQALEGTLDLKASLANREKPYSAMVPSVAQTPSAVFVENDISNVCSVIEITCRDRAGLLYDIATALSALGLSIATAHISTYGAQAADVFYVKDLFGMKITHAQKIHLIRESVLKVL